jgi:hypothetical protein
MEGIYLVVLATELTLGGGIWHQTDNLHGGDNQ